MGNGILQLYSIIHVHVHVHVHVMQAEVSESEHYEAVGFVDHPHPGQEGDFDEEIPVALPRKKGKEWNQGENHDDSHSVINLQGMLYKLTETKRYTIMF